MDNENLNTGTPEQEEDVILPEGYEDENIFEEPSGDGENIFGKEDTLEGFGGEGEDEADPQPEGQPETQEPETEDGVGAESGNSAPAQAQQQEAAGRFKFKDGEREIELQESEFREIYRKAQEHAGLSHQLGQLRQQQEAIAARAKAMGFENAEQMFDKMTENFRESEVKRLVDNGVNEEVARYMVENRMGAQPQQTTQPARQVQQTAPARDIRGEISELMRHRPALREDLSKGGKIPQEVVAAARNGTNLLAAYAEYEAKEARANAERIRQENEILKQNEKNAARAPVKSATAGGNGNNKGKDPFLEGLLSD